MIRFYAPDIKQCCELPESDSQHCVRVLRMREGQEIEVVDGRGGLFRCRIALANQHHTLLEIIEELELPKVWRPDLTVAIAPTKHNDRMEWLVEKLVEIGVDHIVPLRCERSERKDIKIDRLQKIAISAMKQSLKAILPDIQPTTPYMDFIGGCRDGARFIAYCDLLIPRLLFSRELPAATDTTILIGPEGDFSPKEITAALEAGFRPISLGDNRLRTETAALVAADTFHIINQISQ